MTTMLEVRDLSVSYGKLTAVKDVSFAVEEGKIATIIGPNGAGKTTLLKALIGQLPSVGTITYNGADIGQTEVEARVERGIVLVPETRELFTDMVVADNLLLGAYVHRRKTAQVKEDTERVYDLFPRLRERRQQLAGTLSGGERQMLALGPCADGAAEIADARRAEPRSGAADRARDFPHHRAARQGGRHHAAGRAECARRAGDRGLRLCA